MSCSPALGPSPSETPAKPVADAPEADGVAGGNEGLAIGEVHVHGPRPTRLPVGLVTEDHPGTHRVRTLRGERRIREPPRVASVELDLVDRLVRPDPSELGRTIGRQEDHRDPRHPGFDHRGEEVGGGGPARAGDHDRAVRCLREAECEEGARALVQVDVHADPFVARERERDRRRTRSRRDTRIRQPAPLELSDERPGAPERDVALAHDVASAIHSPSASRLHRRPPAILPSRRAPVSGHDPEPARPA